LNYEFAVVSAYISDSWANKGAGLNVRKTLKIVRYGYNVKGTPALRNFLQKHVFFYLLVALRFCGQKPLLWNVVIRLDGKCLACGVASAKPVAPGMA
jgi:hypothetical protein